MFKAVGRSDDRPAALQCDGVELRVRIHRVRVPDELEHREVRVVIAERVAVVPFSAMEIEESLDPVALARADRRSVQNPAGVHPVVKLETGAQHVLNAKLSCEGSEKLLGRPRYEYRLDASASQLFECAMRGFDERPAVRQRSGYDPVVDGFEHVRTPPPSEAPVERQVRLAARE